MIGYIFLEWIISIMCSAYYCSIPLLDREGYYETEISFDLRLWKPIKNHIGVIFKQIM